jgi:hypothetical protein
MAFLFTTLSTYAEFVYPYVMTVLAGGQTRPVVLVPRKEYVATVKALGYTLTDKGTTNIIELIIETQEFLLIRPEDNTDGITSVRMRKDGLDALYYLRRETLRNRR